MKCFCTQIQRHNHGNVILWSSVATSFKSLETVAMQGYFIVNLNMTKELHWWPAAVCSLISHSLLPTSTSQKIDGPTPKTQQCPILALP